MASLNKLFSPFSHLNTLVRVPFRSHVGYMPFEGPIVPRNTPSHLLNREVLNVNLKPVTRYSIINFYLCLVQKFKEYFNDVNLKKMF